MVIFSAAGKINASHAGCQGHAIGAVKPCRWAVQGHDNLRLQKKVVFSAAGINNACHAGCQGMPWGLSWPCPGNPVPTIAGLYQTIESWLRLRGACLVNPVRMPCMSCGLSRHAMGVVSRPCPGNPVTTIAGLYPIIES
jgi:hypothetical protein